MTNAPKKLAAYLLLLLTITSLIFPLPARAANDFNDWFKLDLDKGVLTVSTDYYNLTFNLSRGATLYSATLFYGNESANPLEAAKYVPSLFLYAYSNTSANAPGSSTFKFTYNNETHEASYPGLLATRPWSASIAYSGNDSLVVLLKPGPEASSDIDPLTLQVYVIFYKHLPVIDYYVVFSNPSDEPVKLYSINLSGSQWGPLVELVAGEGDPKDWNMSVVYTSTTGGVKLESSNETGYLVNLEEAYTVEGVALVKSSPSPKYLIALEPITKPALAHLLKGYAGVVREAVRSRLIYPSVVVPPGGNYTIKLRLALAWWDPGSLSMAGLASLYYKIEGSKNLKSVFEHNLVVRNLTSQVDALKLQLNDTKSQLEEARKKAEDASRRAGELEGLLSKCQADYKYVKAQLDSERALAKRAGLYSTASLIVGILLGLAGYKYALQPLFQAATRRGRRR